MSESERVRVSESEYIRCKLIRIWYATPEKVIRTSSRARVVCDNQR